VVGAPSQQQAQLILPHRHVRSAAPPRRAAALVLSGGRKPETLNSDFNDIYYLHKEIRRRWRRC
jgi:hypothetical protein